MKHFSQVVPIILLFSTLSCDTTTTFEEALSYNRQNIKEPERIEDADFLVKAKSLTMLQTSLLQLSREKGYAASAVKLGKERVDNFKELGSDLQELAKKKDIRMPDRMDNAHMQIFEEIAGADKASFDQKFVFTLKSINKQESEIFETAAVKAFDPDVRAFAARNLGQLRNQSEDLDKVEKDLIPIPGGGN